MFHITQQLMKQVTHGTGTFKHINQVYNIKCCIGYVLRHDFNYTDLPTLIQKSSCIDQLTMRYHTTK